MNACSTVGWGSGQAIIVLAAKPIVSLASIHGVTGGVTIATAAAAHRAIGKACGGFNAVWDGVS